MSDRLNKKQKKQLEVARKKLAKLRVLRSAAKEQPDDPADLERLEDEIAAVEQQIEDIKSD